MQQLRVKRDPFLALQLHDLLRFKYGLNYNAKVELYRGANDLDSLTAAEEWEEHMQEAEEVGVW